MMQNTREIMPELMRNNGLSESSSAEGSAAVRGNSAEDSAAVRVGAHPLPVRETSVAVVAAGGGPRGDTTEAT